MVQIPGHTGNEEKKVLTTLTSRPLKGFRLDFTTVLGIFGLMTTYTIVLLQFKIDEKN
jgi:hypothetical protein